VNRIVVDASVAIKWFLPEVHSADALRLLERSFDLHVPDLIFSEVGNALWKRAMKGEISADDGLAVMQGLSAVPLRVWESRALLPAALNLACRLSGTVYDSLYLTVAVTAECQLVTADRKLCNALSQTPLAANVLWVERIP
jgi:predicted nucleic acid-binding protein